MALNEDDQTEIVFKTRRNQVDPVSGNEVPPGSLPEEVRDDIPAMLSEGEYVVPADVLRYYGMKFFEDLREQAKIGMAEMEANGRIGGEPVEVEGSSGISDEELAAMVQQDLSQTQTAAAQGGLMGFQAGGLNFPEYIKQPDITQFRPSGSDFAGGLEYRKLTNDAGMTITIPFFNGEPMGMIPPGYTEGEAATVTQQAAPKAAPKRDDDPNEGAAQRARESYEASQKEEVIDYSNPKSVSEAVDEYYAGSAAPAIVGAFAPGVGVAATAFRYLEKNKLIKGIDEQLKNTELDSDTAKSLSQLKQELQDKDVYRERVGTKGFGEKIKDFFGLDGESRRPDYSRGLANLGGPQKGLEWMGSERDAYNAAVERGDDAIVNHFESINRLRDKQNTFADKGLSRAEGAAMGLSERDMDQAEKYGGSLQRSIDKGEVEKTGGFFSSYEKVEKDDDE